MANNAQESNQTKKSIFGFQFEDPSKENLVVFAIILFIAIPVWIWFVAPKLTKLPADFSYEADILSFDNFYDEQKGQFQGEKRSVTRFAYKTASNEDGIAIIKNTFNVHTIMGDQIFAVARFYGIDLETGAHVAGFGNKGRYGYLFAPKGLKKEEPFIYWHVNYDAPAHMTFVGVETLFGLLVYRYESHYGGTAIDQTENLGHLPEVGVTRGVKLNPHLELWIEPVTGRLVKYADEATAYYYDIKTNEQLHPWNSFSNIYERSSVIKQVQIAKKQKVFFQVVQIVIPFFLAVVAFMALFVGFAKKKLALLAGVVGVLAIGGYFFLPGFVPAKEKQIIIGIAPWVSLESQTYKENIQGFKDALAQAGYREGRNITYFLEGANEDMQKQREIAQGFKKRNADIIYSLTTSGTLIVKEEINDRPIVFSVVTYPVQAGIIQSLENSGNNLVGTRNWVAVKDQLSIFREIVPNVSSLGFVRGREKLNSLIQLGEMQKAARQFGINVVEIAAEDLAELSSALESAQGIDSIFSACDTFIEGEAENVIISFAQRNKLPSFACSVTGPLKGDLVGTVADLYEIGKLAGEKAALILEGAPPSSLETNTALRPFMYINQRTADVLRIIIPQNILAKAKEIIY